MPSMSFNRSANGSPDRSKRPTRSTRMRWLLAPSLVAVCLTSIARTAAAAMCFRGRAGPECTGFPVIEFAPVVRLADKPEPTDGVNSFFIWNLGGMRNIGRQSALGATLKIAADSDGHRLGPAVRYRRWLSRRTGIDLYLGAYVSGSDNFVDMRLPSATADLALNYGDLVGCGIGVDSIRRPGHSSLRQVYIAASWD